MRLLPALLLAATPALADAPVVVEASAAQMDDGWRVTATVRHADEGWDHHADAWAVLTPDGTLLGTRELLHPHDNEQPFTRTLSGVDIPEGADQIVLRAHDSVHGWGADLVVDLP